MYVIGYQCNPSYCGAPTADTRLSRCALLAWMIKMHTAKARSAGARDVGSWGILKLLWLCIRLQLMTISTWRAFGKTHSLSFHIISIHILICLDIHGKPWPQFGREYDSYHFSGFLRYRRARYQSLASGIPFLGVQYESSAHPSSNELASYAMQAVAFNLQQRFHVGELRLVLRCFKVVTCLDEAPFWISRDSSSDPVSFWKGISEPFIDSQLQAFLHGEFAVRCHHRLYPRPIRYPFCFSSSTAQLHPVATKSTLNLQWTFTKKMSLLRSLRYFMSCFQGTGILEPGNQELGHSGNSPQGFAYLESGSLPPHWKPWRDWPFWHSCGALWLLMRSSCKKVQMPMMR